MLDMHGLAVDSVGRSGGLVLLWKKSVSVTIQSFSNRHIDASIQADTRSPIWRFSGIYGDPETSNRKNTWELLTRLKAQSIRPWLCMGDFNEILEDSEKEGGNTRPTWQMRDFRHALDLNGLFDLGFNGDPFTWSNRQEYPNTIRERLDRACANDSWIKLFPNAQVTHLSSVYSDHHPIFLQSEVQSDVQQRNTRRPFRFEATWAGNDECDQIVQQAGEVAQEVRWATPFYHDYINAELN
ncbi:UNVERIFIED_CONTAM: hypothetical protein Sradi_3336400 [Sesamum radiatum]|uniref:Endonuclease/exonuclease/phosphatase domain-containing protein n=1 Tax=Sesamum radiatum TaxID=300843 RepID=A0AAW2R2A7_SESRA